MRNSQQVPAARCAKRCDRDRFLRHAPCSLRRRHLGHGERCAPAVLPPLRAGSTCPAGSSLQVPSGGSSNQAQCVITSTGTPVGGVRHVWLIILENKSYDETFTGLEPEQLSLADAAPAGCAPEQLRRHRHFNMDNYISPVSGQSPSYGVQDDCSPAAPV